MTAQIDRVLGQAWVGLHTCKLRTFLLFPLALSILRAKVYNKNVPKVQVCNPTHSPPIPRQELCQSRQSLQYFTNTRKTLILLYVHIYVSFKSFLSRFCPVALVSGQGFILPGNRRIGFLRFEGKFFSPSTVDRAEQFGRNPRLFLRAIKKLSGENPCLLSLLDIQRDDEESEVNRICRLSPSLTSCRRI